MTYTETRTFTEEDVVYVGQQIFRDLRQIRKAYPDLLSEDHAEDIRDAILTFLSHEAVDKIGFSIYDPSQENLVFHEWSYTVLEGDALPDNLLGSRQGGGGAPVQRIPNLPKSTRFTSWVVWSQEFINADKDKQSAVSKETGWPLPGTGAGFHRKLRNELAYMDQGFYVSGGLGVHLRTYRDEP